MTGSVQYVDSATGDGRVVVAALAALDSLEDAVILMDLTPRIVHANAAACALFGHSLEVLLALDPRTVIGADYDALVRDAVWGQVLQGQPWSGTLMFGATAHNVLLSPATDSEGAVTGYVAIMRSLARTYDREADLVIQDQDRAAILHIMSEVQASSTVQATANAMCEAVANIGGIDGAMILLLPPSGDLVHVSNVGPTMPGFEFGARIPLERLEQLIAVTASGPWFLDLHHPMARALLEDPIVDAMLELGITATAYAAIRSSGSITGVLTVASFAADGAGLLAARLGSLEQLGGLAGTLLGNQAVQFGQAEGLRNELRDVIANQRFHTVFQPIVHMSDGMVLGYEALTRFDSGRRPDEVLADAHSVGMGIELEDACVRLALASSEGLSDDVQLSLNYSPEAVVGGSVALTLGNVERPLVVEITEHVRIASYEELRQAMGKHPSVRIAVDDAGAGFASLSHILELRPDFVKLDINLVRDIDSDPARSAMVAGMCHFASVTGTRLIAEGVETQAEADTLGTLGVELAQGYFFGRPEPLSGA